MPGLCLESLVHVVSYFYELSTLVALKPVPYFWSSATVRVVF